MRVVFVDSSFYIAFAHVRDGDHAAAVRLSFELDAADANYVTSPAVILKVLAYFSRLGPRLRERAALLAERLMTSAIVDVVALDKGILRAAVDLYRDLSISGTASPTALGMVICRERRITEVLTTDGDFEAEGFMILLKR